MKAIIPILLGASLAAAQPRTLKDFGVAGDGKTDDTRAIQQAVDEGAELRFPRGRYLITRTIEARVDRTGPFSISGDGATIVMAGPGPALRIVGTHSGTADPATFKDGMLDRERAPMIDGLEIVGQHERADGIRIEGAMQATLTRLVIRNVNDGIVLMGRNRNVSISTCHIYNNRGAGILLDQLNLHQINITGAHVSYNRRGGIVARNSEIRNIQIAGCDIEANMSPGGPPTANVLFDTRAGSIREGAITGCTIQHGHDTKDGANIRFLGQRATNPLEVGNFAIADNALSDVAVNIHLRHARGVTIIGNTLWKGYQQNLLVEGSSNIVVGPNNFDRNPDYGAPDSADSVMFTDSSESTISGLHSNGARADAAITLRRCRTINVNGCTILNSSGMGLLLDDVNRVRVSGCLIQLDQAKPAPAIRLTGGRENLISDNLVNAPLDVASGAARVSGER